MDTLASSNFPATRDERTAEDSRSRRFFIRLAIKVSRARWYSFLRRVFHYQNGSGLDIGPNPFDSWNWMVMEFITLAVQICVSVFTLIISRKESPGWPIRIWVLGYALGCLLGFILLCWRYRLIYLNGRDDANVHDVEQQTNHQESRNLQYLHKHRATLELLFAIWFVIGIVWVFGSRFMSFRRAPKLHMLCISLLAWNSVSYSFPFILFVLLCCCVPLLSRILGYNINKGSLNRGATDEHLAALPSWKYKEFSDNSNSEIPECCICLAKYRDKEEIRQLPCTHIFHLKCVDQWLKIMSCCPLCKKGMHK